MTLPTPYYSHDGIQIFHADCRDILPDLPQVDLVLTDPPYNIGYSYASYKDKMTEESYVEMLNQFDEFPCVMIHYPEEFMRYILPAMGPPEAVSAWCYVQNQPRRFRLIGYWNCGPAYERILKPYRNPDDKRVQALMTNGSAGTPLYEWWDDIHIVRNVSKEKTAHPCPVPLRLMERIITLTTIHDTIEPALILDPFCGSGTTLRAAKDLRRKAIGIEIEEKYCEIAAKRLEQEVFDFT